MIRLYQGAAFPVLPTSAEDWQLHRLRLLFQAYGTDCSFCRFYRQQESGALFCVLEDSGLVWAAENADPVELAAYVRMTGVRRVSATGSIGLQLTRELPEFALQSGSIMEKRAAAAGQADKLQYAEAMPLLLQGYQILSAAFPVGDFAAWYCDVSHRIRHGAAKVCLWEQTGCAVLQQTGDSVFLSAVAVQPEVRRCGIGGRMLRAVETACAGKRLGVYSFSQDSDRFYRRLNFCETGSWYSLER